MAARFGALTEGGFPYIAAENNGVLAGYAYAGPFRPRPAYRFVVEDSIYIAPEAKGRGIGRLLLERLIAEAESGGFRQMIAVIGDGGPESPSVKLHERLGFPPFRSAARLGLQARPLAGYGFHAAFDEWRHGSRAGPRITARAALHGKDPAKIGG